MPPWHKRKFLVIVYIREKKKKKTKLNINIERGKKLRGRWVNTHLNKPLLKSCVY